MTGKYSRSGATRFIFYDFSFSINIVIYCEENVTSRLKIFLEENYFLFMITGLTYECNDSGK